MARRAETTVAECSLTSCVWDRFRIGSLTMPWQRHSQPTAISLCQGCMHVPNEPISCSRSCEHRNCYLSLQAPLPSKKKKKSWLLRTLSLYFSHLVVVIPLEKMKKWVRRRRRRGKRRRRKGHEFADYLCHIFWLVFIFSSSKAMEVSCSQNKTLEKIYYPIMILNTFQERWIPLWATNFRLILRSYRLCDKNSSGRDS